MPISSWSITPADNATADSANGISWPEGMSPASVNDSARAMMAEIKKSVASDTAQGLVELATSAEVLTGTDTERAVTPAGLAANQSLATSGYKKFPGGLIMQWGEVDVTLNGNGDQTLGWPASFTTRPYSVQLTSGNLTTSTSEAIGEQDPLNRTTSGTIVSFRPNPGAVTRRVNFFVIGK